MAGIGKAMGAPTAGPVTPYPRTITFSSPKRTPKVAGRKLTRSVKGVTKRFVK